MSIRLFFLLTWMILPTTVRAALPVRVAVSVYPLQAIASEVGGDRIAVHTMIPPHADPHHFEPTPSMVRKLKESQLFFGITPAFDGWAQRFLPPTCRVIYLMRPGQSNEHIWLTLSGGDAIGMKMAQLFMEIDPDGIPGYRERLAAFRDAIREAGIAIRSLLRPLKNRAIIQYHPAWDRFAAEFGLTIAGTVTHGHGQQPSPGDLIRLIQAVQRKHVSAIVIGLEPVGSAVNTLVRQTGVKPVRLDPLGAPDKPGFQHYPELLVSNATLLAKALQ